MIQDNMFWKNIIGKVDVLISNMPSEYNFYF